MQDHDQDHEQKGGLPDANGHQPDYDSYRFHDPDFVAWWLGGLYLFPATEQVQIAQGLFQRVNIPEVQAVVADFIETRGGYEIDQGIEPGVVDDAIDLASMTAKEAAVASLKRSWREQKPLFVMIMILFVFFAFRGFMILWNAALKLFA